MSKSILAFAGSTREDSLNKKLVKAAASMIDKLGVPVTVIDLRDYALPLYDADLESHSGFPAAALTLRKLMQDHTGFLFSCPEYNGSMSAVFKNAIDWASRPKPDEPDLLCFKKKVVALLSASPGGLGGLRGLVPVRLLMGNIGSLVIPTQFALSKAHTAFNEAGDLVDERAIAGVTAVVQELLAQ